MRFLRNMALILALCLVLQCAALAVDSVSLGGAGLDGRHFLVLGDSYTAGYGLKSLDEDWTSLMASRYGMTQLNFSVSGSTIAAGFSGYYPMVDRVENLPEDATLSFIIIQGGSNDWHNGIPLGGDSDRDPNTFCGALNLIIDTLQKKYPQAVLVGFTPWISDGTLNRVRLTQQDYTDAMLRIFAGRDLICYDASDADSNGMRLNQREFRETYCLHGGDWYHLSASGHAMFAPIFSAWLERTLYPSSIGDRFYDLAGASEEMRFAAASLVDAGVLSPTAAHLFSPTRSATRAELAEALYRLAGSPKYTQRTLTDVSADDPAYPAICWCMDSGIFSPADTFAPTQVVPRDMLAAVLFRYYQDYLGGFPDALVGLGTYRDGNLVDAYARTGMGWALSTGVLTDYDGYLKPKGAVSRGQLALSLAALRRVPGVR